TSVVSTFSLHDALPISAFERAVESAATPAPGLLSGVPFFVKDNTDVADMPTGNGTDAYVPRKARRHGRVAKQLLSAGFTVLGKRSEEHTSELQSRENLV